MQGLQYIRPLRHLLGIIGLLIAASAAAQTQPPDVDARAVEENLQALKADVIALNRDLTLLEEDLLFPASNRVEVFVSADAGRLFGLSSVRLELNGQVVANHIYQNEERTALERGGMHRLYLGNLSSGDHQLVAFFTGKGPNGRDWRRATDLSFEKDGNPAVLELRIVDDQARLGPEFVVKQWERP